MVARFLVEPENDYPPIRRAIDVTLDSVLVPDAVIEDPLILGEAEDEVLRRVPAAAGFAALDETVRERIRRLVIVLAAERLVWSVPALVSVQQGENERYQRVAINPGVVSTRLRGDAERLVALVNGAEAEVGGGERRSHFRRAPLVGRLGQ